MSKPVDGMAHSPIVPDATQSAPKPPKEAWAAPKSTPPVKPSETSKAAAGQINKSNEEPKVKLGVTHENYPLPLIKISDVKFSITMLTDGQAGGAVNEYDKNGRFSEQNLIDSEDVHALEEFYYAGEKVVNKCMKEAGITKEGNDSATGKPITSKKLVEIAKSYYESTKATNQVPTAKEKSEQKKQIGEPPKVEIGKRSFDRGMPVDKIYIAGYKFKLTYFEDGKGGALNRFAREGIFNKADKVNSSCHVTENEMNAIKKFYGAGEAVITKCLKDAGITKEGIDPSTGKPLKVTKLIEIAQAYNKANPTG